MGQKKVAKKQYKGHCLPTGCMPVPVSEDSNDEDNDPIPPDGDVPFPPSCRGCLDAGTLQKLGMSH
eukprot:7872623-Ditylum_brightwellii.AAC.2